MWKLAKYSQIQGGTTRFKSGDIIIGINRQPIESTQDLRKALDEKPSAVALNILRGKNNFYLLSAVK